MADAGLHAVRLAVAPERYKVQFTASRQMLERLRYARDLLRHVVPTGDVATVFDCALSALIEQSDSVRTESADFVDRSEARLT